MILLVAYNNREDVNMEKQQLSKTENVFFLLKLSNIYFHVFCVFNSSLTELWSQVKSVLFL